MHPCDFNAYNEGGWEVCEFKGAGHWLMDAANVIGETNLYVVEQRLIIHFNLLSQRTYSAEVTSILLQLIYLQKT